MQRDLPHQHTDDSGARFIAPPTPPASTRGAQYMALTAAFLGWMFDGLEMGLFPLVARPALTELMGPSAASEIGTWLGWITAGFLVGAACGGLLFGWLGDRIGRVRAMVWSVLTYAIFSGLCGFAEAPWQIAALRFIAALGMGGEWSLGVALVMEIWPSNKRPMLAGLIGAASNVGFLLIGMVARTNLVDGETIIEDDYGNRLGQFRHIHRLAQQSLKADFDHVFVERRGHIDSANEEFRAVLVADA